MHIDINDNHRKSLSAEQRESLQSRFDNTFSTGDKVLLRKQYRELRQLELSTDFDFENEVVDIASLAESLTVACDIIVSDLGISFIYCGNDTSPVLCNPRYTTKAILNLLSNAFLYGRESLVTVKTIESGNFVKLEIQNGGGFANSFKNGSGLQFVRRVCEKCGGNFFIEQATTSTRAVMALRKSENLEKCLRYSFNSFIDDRLSPVYVELFGMEYH